MRTFVGDVLHEVRVEHRGIRLDRLAGRIQTSVSRVAIALRTLQEVGLVDFTFAEGAVWWATPDVTDSRVRLDTANGLFAEREEFGRQRAEIGPCPGSRSLVPEQLRAPHRAHCPVCNKWVRFPSSTGKLDKHDIPVTNVECRHKPKCEEWK